VELRRFRDMQMPEINGRDPGEKRKSGEREGEKERK
jgi:hypothetical protein